MGIQHTLPEIPFTGTMGILRILRAIPRMEATGIPRILRVTPYMETMGSAATLRATPFTGTMGSALTRPEIQYTAIGRINGMPKVEPLTVGWIVDAPFGDFAFEAPEAKRKDRSPALSGRAVQACPAVNELEKRLFVVKAPFDIKIGVEKDGENYELFYDEQRTRVDPDVISRFITFMPQNLWRSPKRPVFQILLPYVFLCDEKCYLTQFPPFLDECTWPGQMIAGRFEITNWPRILNFAFEFCDLNSCLELRRGQPLCYFMFEGDNPERSVRLVRAKQTEEVRQFRKGIDGMPKFTSNTFSVMDEAARRRPRNLVISIEDGDEV